MTHSLYLSHSLKNLLSKIPDGESSSGHSTDHRKKILSIIKQSKQDFLTILQGLDDKIDLLESSIHSIQSVIAVIEEAGGLSVRARNLIQEQDGITKYHDKISDAQNGFIKALEKIDACVEQSAFHGVNLLKGEKVEIHFDTNHLFPLIIQGIDLQTKSLGFRTPDFSSTTTIQNARIDVANALDLAITLRNIISADVSTIRMRREFCETSLSCMSQMHDLISQNAQTETPDHISTLLHYDFLGDASSLAEDSQLELLHHFRHL